MRSPLDEAGLTKDEIRELSRRAGLPTWDEPASACLSSRIPYFSEVTDEKLRTIERAEEVLRDLGFRICRVRHHDTIARIELGRDEMPRALEPEMAATIDRELRALGYAARRRRSARLPPGQPERRAASRVQSEPACRESSRRSRFCSSSRTCLYLPPTLEDIDSINFALGVARFRRRPASAASARLSGVHRARQGVDRGRPGARRPRSRCPPALALLSALAGTALIPLLFALFRRSRRRRSPVHGGRWPSRCCSPLLWFTALRPLSDMTGLAFAIAAQVAADRCVRPELDRNRELRARLAGC